MNWVTGILVYVLIWWIVLFMVLPWGVRVPDEAEPGHATSAPERPLMWRKVMATSLIAALVWGAFFYVLEMGWLRLLAG